MLNVLLLAATLLQNGTVQGVVRAQGSREPLPHATVRIVELNRSAPADARGYFVLSGVPNGRWRAEASAIGYDVHAVTLVVSGGTVRIDFELPVKPVPMPVLEVRSTPAGTPGSETTHAPLPQVGPPAVRVHSRALRTVPGLVEPDVLRALQALPSIAAMSDFSTALYVRGGAADQSVITLDGMPLFNPYHVGGIFSAIPVDAVSTVDVWPGAMPARAGDRLSGAVQVHTRDGGRDRTRASGGIGLLSSHATVDGPLGGGSYIVSGRRTYLDAITGAAHTLRLIDGTLPYGFWDAYAKATLPVGALGSLAISGYVDRERIRTNEAMERDMDGAADFAWGSSMAALNFRQPLSPAVLFQARLGFSGFAGQFDAREHRRTVFACGTPCPAQPEDTVDVVRAYTRTSAVIAATELTYYRGEHTLRAGVQLDRLVLDHALEHIEDVDEALFPLFHDRTTPTMLAGWAENEWRLSPRFAARLGARALHAGELGTALLPRVGAHYQLTPRLALSAGAGAYAQSLRSKRNDESMISSFIAYDLITAQPAGVGLARGTDLVLGASLADVNTAIRAEAYYKRMSNLVLPGQVQEPMRSPPIITDGYVVGGGTARGLELSAQHRYRGAELGVSYSLAFAERTADTLRYRPRFERRHMLDASAALRWHEEGTLSARLAVGSGQPYTPVIGLTETRTFNPVTGVWEFGSPTLVLGDYNAARLPGYLRLDVAARRSWHRTWFGRPVRVTPYVQVLNVLNTRNALFAEAQSFAGPSLRYAPQLPFLPTFGFEWQH